MFTINWCGLEEEVKGIMEAVNFQMELRKDGFGSDLWHDGKLLRSIYKDYSDGSWIVETPEATFKIVEG